MKKIMNFYQKNGKWFLFCLGIAGCLVMALMYLILGTDSIVPFHDQLDGEVSGYMLHAKYLFTNVSSYQEMMNGIPANGLFPPAPLLILFYRIFPAFTAYAVGHIFCMLIAFSGMYICISKVTRNYLIAFICGILFAYAPLFGVYGLCQYGLPMLFYCFYLLLQGKKKIASLFYIVIFGFASSLVLIGYAILGFACLYILYLLIKKQWKAHVWFSVGTLVLLITYLITNVSLILQIFKIGEQVPSHKEILVRYGQDFWVSFLDIFYRGTVHTATHQQLVVIASSILIVISLLFRKKISARLKPFYTALYVMYALNVVFALFYAVIHLESVANLRNKIGGVIKEFQPDRIYWLSTALWFFILALFLYLIWQQILIWKASELKVKNILIVVSFLFGSATTLGYAFHIYYYCDFNKEVHRLVYGESYEQFTWNDFYAVDVMQEMKEFIGEDPSSYRTLSFGIFPAAALYNGFYCLDGYSNNYSLAYMQQFRGIIAAELEKNADVKQYYDDWGCRCYLYSGEWGLNMYSIGKNQNPVLNNLDLDFAYAYDMGARYLFSAVQIPDAENKGLTLMRDEPFSTATSYYAIYLYQIHP